MKNKQEKSTITLTRKETFLNADFRKSNTDKRRFYGCNNLRLSVCNLRLSAFRNAENITQFESGVYKEVAKIPKGEIASYKDIAVRIGRPKAYRAVANALAKNPFVGKVPCHRVIKSDSTIGGFSKGVETKKKMLESEGLKIKGDFVII